MNKSKTLYLKKDIIIPKGTIFTCEDGRVSKYVNGNYSTTIGLTDNTCGELMYGFESELLEEWFDESVEVIKEN